jgi:hypothetical protein
MQRELSLNLEWVWQGVLVHVAQSFYRVWWLVRPSYRRQVRLSHRLLHCHQILDRKLSPAELPCNSVIQPTLQSTRSVLQNLTLRFDI